MGLTALFGTIHGSHCTISAEFYIYLQYSQQKIFNFSKQTNNLPFFSSLSLCPAFMSNLSHQISCLILWLDGRHG